MILYFSDFDPSGYQMPTSVSRKIQALQTLLDLRFDMQVHQAALTLEQVVELGLPTTPLSDEDKRKDRWMELTGREQTELDALLSLRPGVLERIAEDALAPFFDRTLAARWRDARYEWEERADEWLKAQPQYEAVRTEISVAHYRVEEAIEQLNRAQRFAVDELHRAAEDSYDKPDPLEGIEAELTVPIPTDPVFTTADTWLDATLKLKARKSLKAKRLPTKTIPN